MHQKTINQLLIKATRLDKSGLYKKWQKGIGNKEQKNSSQEPIQQN